MRVKRRLILLAWAFAAAGGEATATVVLHDQSVLSPRGSYVINRAHHAQDFHLSTPSTITSVSAWIAETTFPGVNDGVVDGFTSLSWGLYRDAQGKPGTLLKQGHDLDPFTADTPYTFSFGGDILRVDVFIDSAVLPAGDYWMALHEGDWQTPNTRSVGWVSAESTFGIGHYIDDLEISGVAWTGPFGEQAFQVLGRRLPEPSVVSTVAIAVLSGSDWRRRSRNRPSRRGRRVGVGPGFA
jgi:hypothetical protein